MVPSRRLRSHQSEAGLYSITDRQSVEVRYFRGEAVPLNTRVALKLNAALGATIALVLLLGSPGDTVVAGDGPSVEEESLTPLIVTFSRTPRITDRRVVQRLERRIDHEFHLLHAFVVSLPESSVELLLQRPGVLAVEEDTAVQAVIKDLPWGVEHIGADLVHGYNQGEGVRVAVIDTGIDLDHPDLSVASHVSFVFGAPTGNDDNGHGMHVAGTVAALDNSIGVIRSGAPGPPLGGQGSRLQRQRLLEQRHQRCRVVGR